VIVNALRRNPRPSKPVLDADASGPVRDRLVNEIAALGAVETAIEWAGQNLGAKNTLTAEDASIVEAAFRGRMQVLEPEVYSPGQAPADLPTPATETALQRGSSDPAAAANARAFPSKPPGPRKIQSSRLPIEGANNSTLVKPRRSRNKGHLRFITGQPCTVCGRRPCEAHHLRFSQPRALGRRVSDEFTVPLCRVHHRELHRQGDERAWWNKANIDPMPIALGFWQHTRGVPLAASSNQKAQEPETNGPIEEPSGAGGNPFENLPSLIVDVADGGATR
jgi:hypothetical protein